MPYQPGPFGRATAADIHIAPGVYDFADDAAGLQAELAGVSAGWNGMINDLEAMATEPWDAELNADLLGMVQDLDATSAGFDPPYMDTVIHSFFDTQALLDGATSFAPAQAWLDPGAPFEPPDTLLTLVAPTVNPDTFAIAPNTVVGSTTEGRNPAVGIFNITRYGSQNFSVGDQLEVVALGKLNDDVVVIATLNGETLPPLDEGQMDASGQMFITVTLGPETKGIWNQKWYINGAIMADFNFVVSD